MGLFLSKLAHLSIKYSLNVQPGQKVLISGNVMAQDLTYALFKEILESGAHPTIYQKLPQIEEIFYTYASKEQLEYVDPFVKPYSLDFDKEVYIMGSTNTRQLELIDSNKISTFESSPERVRLDELAENRVTKGEFQWLIVPYPCEALAQDAGMGLFAYHEFISNALYLNYENPADQWKQIEGDQQNYVDYLNQVDILHVVGEDTDLKLSVKGRTWVNCCGHVNLPDGEVFTGPLEDSINGHIRFSFPGIYQSKEIENIYLEFKEGKIVKATASKGQKLLVSILKIKGANGIGEFAIGTNYGITKFSKNMLFDEKMGGTIHMALGMGYGETGSLSKSAIHWDLLKDMKSRESYIEADGKIIYRAGKWEI
ncbi:hypothetical protein NEF87_003882 [Candidatus Lokiarchaeum ossiferum]|uniref:Aminopeptidase n=1 Tax=Candidatus Lokiarchaeum ossiferum TaxID=2951803 RepID=A0ABY6HVP7_9ARCH|nr:hypothetical protein NEF87_003882 [Candidatus Lokiarchaeum sp. B-35]